MQHKGCTKCRRYLPLSDFNKNRSGRLRRTSYCKDCLADDARKRSIKKLKDKVADCRRMVAKFEDLCEQNPNALPEYLSMTHFKEHPKKLLRSAQISLLWSLTRPAGRTTRNTFKADMANHWPGDDEVAVEMMEELCPEQGPLVVGDVFRWTAY